MKQKVVIDTDPGIDDAVAILLALSSKNLDVQALTTVAGNTDIEMATLNALKILDYASNNEIPVYKGNSRPLKKPIRFSHECHGSDGLGNSNLPLPSSKSQEIPADEYLIEKINQNPGEITILSIGPMTNIAKAIQKSPKSMRKTKEIISMGGGINIGNMSPVAEFNYWTDPDAAEIVYSFDIPITMIGLNATSRAIFTPDDLRLISLMCNKSSRLISSIQDFYLNYYWEYENVLGVIFHDSVAVAITCNKSIGRSIFCNVQISTDGITRGECVADVLGAWNKKKNTQVVMDIDIGRYKDLFFELLFPELECKKIYKKYKKFIQNLEVGKNE